MQDLEYPIPLGFNLSEDSLRRVARREDPEWDQDGKEPENVNDKYRSFNHGKFSRKDSVEDDAESGDHDDKECSMPSLEDVILLIED